jgi:hypothetical protein
VGQLSGDQPWVYLTISDASSGDQVDRFRSWGDVPEDAYRLLESDLPWEVE